jgi:hypothetical protein
MIKTGENVAVIKPTSKQDHNPRQDPPIPSVLTQHLQRDGKKLTFIKQEVSNTKYITRGTSASSKLYNMGA